MGLPSSTTADTLLSASGKKSGLKQGAAWKMGAQKTIECKHVDGGNVKLAVQVCVPHTWCVCVLGGEGMCAQAGCVASRLLALALPLCRGVHFDEPPHPAAAHCLPTKTLAQAVSKDGKSSQRLLMVLRVNETTTGSLAPLLAMKGEGGGELAVSGNSQCSHPPACLCGTCWPANPPTLPQQTQQRCCLFPNPFRSPCCTSCHPVVAHTNTPAGSGNERLLKGQGRASSSGSDDEGGAAGGTATTKAPHKGGKSFKGGDGGDSDGSGGGDKSEDGEDERRPARRRGDSPELHERLDSRWVGGVLNHMTGQEQ